MATQLGNTGVTFGDSSTQNTASQYISRYYGGPSSGTWSKPTNLKAVKVTIVAGGGAGGTGQSPYTTGSGKTLAGVTGGAGGGGGGGGAAIRYLAASEITASSVPYTVGAAGAATSFGPWATGSPTSAMTATAGSAGVQNAYGGAGGSASGSPNLAIGGSSGGGGVGVNSGTNFGGAGGGTMLGGGGTYGGPGITYGGGGGGGAQSQGGGAGASGVMIVEEFY
jgi:hypothetical protein